MYVCVCVDVGCSPFYYATHAVYNVLHGRTTFAGLASAGRTSAGRHLPVWTFAGRTSAGLRHLPVGHLPVGTFAGLEKSDHLGLF